MALIRWEPFREIATLQNEMARLLKSGGEGNGQDGRNWVPAVDVWETENEVVYAFDLPGIPEDKINVEFEDNSLTVSAERERTDETSNDRFYRFERHFGSFSRTIGLPQGVSESDVSADYREGVLEVHVKKAEQPKARRIPVGSGAKATIEGSSKKA